MHKQKMRKRVRAPSRRRVVKKFRGSTKMPIVSYGPRISPRTGFGTRIRMKMIYCSSRNTINPGASGALGAFQFRLNSIFDPDFTGIGRQPTGHDEMANLFATYCVVAATYKVSFLNTSATSNYIIGVYSNDTNSLPADANRAIEQGECQWTQVSAQDGSVKEFKGRVDMPKLFGKSYQAYISDSNFNTPFGQNPGDGAYLTLFASAADTADPDAIYLTTEIVFDVLCTGSTLTPES